MTSIFKYWKLALLKLNSKESLLILQNLVWDSLLKKSEILLGSAGGHTEKKSLFLVE